MKEIVMGVILILSGIVASVAQNVSFGLNFSDHNLFIISSLVDPASGKRALPAQTPLFSVLIDSIPRREVQNSVRQGDTIYHVMDDSLLVNVIPVYDFKPGLKYLVRFINKGVRSRKIENLVPLGQGVEKVYITASGSKEWPGYLCRSKLWLPGKGPIGVLLPDNAWHLGFCDMKVADSLSLTALARRVDRDKEKTAVDRWAVTVKQNGWVEYAIYVDLHKGDWHHGLSMMFGDRWLYDLPQFDQSLFRRTDLQWMKGKYLMLLQFAWDKKYYDPEIQQHTFYKSLFEFDSLTGGYDIFTLWPTWPRLGLDQRNQWDMYRDLPGGLEELREQAGFCHKHGKKYFISYNPWDEGTRKEDHFHGMEELLRKIDADGVVLDTRGESSRELQATADRVKPGIVMYSEGMAVPKDMPGIVSGRVHDALVLPPPLNLNKLIKNDFAIFRVLQLADDRLHRELSIAMFNGYGVELNTMRPGRPDWMLDEYKFMGSMLQILRDHSPLFTNGSLFPLHPSLVDSIYINRWSDSTKWIYTIYSENPAGCHGTLFHPVIPAGMTIGEFNEKFRTIDLLKHLELKVVPVNGIPAMSVQIDAFDRNWLNTRKEGSPGAVAVFHKRITVKEEGSELTIQTKGGSHLLISEKNTAYSNRNFKFNTGQININYLKLFGKIPEKIIIRLYAGTSLLDEAIWNHTPGLPVQVSTIARTVTADTPPAGMVEIPAGPFRYYTKRDPGTLEPFILLPDHQDTVMVMMNRFFMDRYPVTNSEYYRFVLESEYKPADTVNYLKHWKNGKPEQFTENMPVVNVSPEDARAYSLWAGKRLPSEMEWQYAAQGTDMRKYPWGNTLDSTRCNYNLNYLLPVNHHPSGASPFGVEDMVGNVWQMTDEIYNNGSYRFSVIRGGSYYHPTQSIWYVTGGPLPADHPEMLLLVAPGLDRNNTVGFRCVKDAR
jgi:formylglycine-generating enzyme required for sulfatase activity